MKTCQDCIGFNYCADAYYKNKSDFDAEKCLTFKNKHNFIETPCPIGSDIYLLVTKRPKLNMPPFTFIKKSILTFNNLERVIAGFGKTAFLTYEEANIAKEDKEKTKRCKGCIFENVNDVTEIIGNCVGCNRIYEDSKYDGYIKKEV